MMLRLLICIALSSTLASNVSAQSDSLIVTVLGTGTPNPRLDHLGPSTLVQAGAETLLFDAGRGTTIALEEVGVLSGRITGIFLTHYHSDHTNGLPDVWLTGWLPPFGARSTPLRVWGPSGLRELLDGLQRAYATDVRMRSAEEKLPPAGASFEAHEFAHDSVVFSENGVVVTAFSVDHGEFLKPAVGYRVQYAGHSVVISGDTRPSPNLVAHAKGVDLLVHEVAMAPDAIRDIPAVKKILSVHTSPAQAAAIFSEVHPRLAVFTHFAFPPNRNGKSATPEDVLNETRRGYSGPVALGEDLLRIVVSDEITIQKFDRTRKRYIQ